MERRYIDADVLQARLERKKAGIANQRYTEGWNDCMMRVKSMVSKAPLADVTPVVHGHWIKDNDSFQTDDYYCCYFDYNCSECGEIVNDRYKLPNYCPDCGAKMDVETGDK